MTINRRVLTRASVLFKIGVLAVFAWMLCVAQASAQRSQQDYDRFEGVMSPVVSHTSWTGTDGAPQKISVMVQSSDGFLWLGTFFGLYRFDGLDFARYPTTSLSAPLPSIDVEALCADSSGGLWIGFHSGGISHLSADGRLENYNPENHRGPRSVQKFVLRPDGSVWAIADYRLYRLNADRWEDLGAKLGLPGDPLFCLYFDRRGRLWTSTRHALFYHDPSSSHFQLFATPSFMIVDMAEAPDGQLWVSDAWRTVRPLLPSKEHPGWQVTGYVRMIADSSGMLWMAQDYRGVTHVSLSKGQSLPVKEPELSSEQTNAILLDHDGSVWVGTSRGLDRFRSTSLMKLSNAEVEYYPSLCTDKEHGVWLAALAHPVVHAVKGVLTPIGHAVGSSPIVCDDRGAVWMVDPIRNMLTRWDSSGMTRIPIPEEVHQASAGSMGLDRDGALLVSFKPNGFWRFDGSWTRMNEPNLPPDEPLSIVRDPRGNIWLGYANSLIVEHDSDGYHTFSGATNGALGNVLTFAVVDGHIFAAGTNGVAYLDRGIFRRVSLARDQPLVGVSGLLEDEAKNLWMNSSSGILRVAHEQLAHLDANPTGLEYELFDDREGITGTATALKPTPSVAADRDGTLWFSMSGELISLQPQLASTPRPIPPLIIERVTVNGLPLIDREHPIPVIPLQSSRIRELEIDYIGIDMAAPEKIVYRYLLEGEDKVWHDVGSRRQAFYTHLSPGKYRFRLMAASANGKWTELSTPLVLLVAPAFYQTKWFIAATALAAIGALYLAYILRVTYLTNALRRRLKLRTDERLRIARDLHDTLLQSIHGLMLRFHFATEGISETEPVRAQLELALQRADDVFVEARRSIESLRDEIPEEPDFASQLAKVAEQLELRKTMEFRVVEEGPRRFLNGHVQAELCKIAREALLNSMHHGKASSAEVCVIYQPLELRMKCSDDGGNSAGDRRRGT
jgi:ligand-binding sensor domain-containing protein